MVVGKVYKELVFGESFFPVEVLCESLPWFRNSLENAFLRERVTMQQATGASLAAGVCSAVDARKTRRISFDLALRRAG